MLLLRAVLLHQAVPHAESLKRLGILHRLEDGSSPRRLDWIDAEIDVLQPSVFTQAISNLDSCTSIELAIRDIEVLECGVLPQDLGQHGQSFATETILRYVERGEDSVAQNCEAANE